MDRALEEYREYAGKKTAAMRRRTNQGFYNKEKLAALTHYSNGRLECACCHEKEYLFLGLDHIVPVGKLRKKNAGSIYSQMRRESFPPGLQVLCHNCNMAKRGLPTCPVHNPPACVQDAL